MPDQAGFLRSTAPSGSQLGPLIVEQSAAALDTDGSLKVADVFTGGEVLADQAGDATVKTFTFTTAVDLVWVRCVGAVGRADPFGGTPTASVGIYCAADEPTPLTVRTTVVKVVAPSGTISCWGFRG